MLEQKVQRNHYGRQNGDCCMAAGLAEKGNHWGKYQEGSKASSAVIIMDAISTNLRFLSDASF
jgi:hypothetical protein